ncbi:iron-containing redox enzyme family protein [Auraticoccus monumenti]|uniref:Iron-containing redox enzyme n=1 Tax=Auraticoccus monumenti TaxID=675864 RepID=A0A1G6UUK5_9ACTN|nr:iron-containing redox enzyme family protein [Auraticoccus monumenti]SDD45110.1 Iron-containing redox enzyme [Auraticoccus monumenti]
MTTTTHPAVEVLDRLELPAPCGPLSEAVLATLRGQSPTWPSVDDADPFGRDLQLALALGYEPHYRSIEGVSEDVEWDPSLLAARTRMEGHFLAALRAGVAGGDDVDAVVQELLVEPVEGTGVSWHLAADGEAWQFAEYVAHRAHYHRKEADPQSWVVPRLQGAAKAGLVTVEHDEYGAGRAGAMHSWLYAEMMTELGLDHRYGAYLGDTSRWVLAEVNLQTLCGLRRSLRGASVGLFAVIELTSSPGSARLVKAARRLGLGPASEYFYAEHVEADAVHEQVLRRDVLRPLLALEPHLGADVVFGIQASDLLGDGFSAELLGAWARGERTVGAPLG